MRRFIIIAIAVIVIATSEGAHATSGIPTGMPKNIRSFLDNMCGSWRMDGATKGTSEYEWNPGQSTLIGVEQFQIEDVSGTLSDIWHWDGISEQGVILSWSCTSNEGFAYGEVQGKVLSPTLMEGRVDGVELGLTFSADVRVEFQGPNQYTWRRTNVIDDGEQKPDSMAVFTRVKSVSGQEELIQVSPVMKRLEVFVGDWTYEGEQADSPADLPFGEAGEFSGTITTHFILGGSFLQSKMKDKNPAGITSIIEMTKYDTRTKNYIVNSYVSDGSRDSAVQTVSPDGKLWMSQKTFTTKTGKEVLLKSVVTFSPDWSSYTSVERYSVDAGKTWIHWYKFEAKKVSTSFQAAEMADAEDRNIATLHRYWNELLNENDISKAHEIIAPDFTLYVNREPVEPRGTEIFKQMGESDRRMSDNQFFEDEIVAAGNTITSRWHGTAIHDKEVSGYRPLPNDQKITWEGMCFYHFDENGLMTDGYLVTNLWEQFEKRERSNKPVDVESRNKAVVKRYIGELLNKKDHSKANTIISPEFTIHFGETTLEEKGLAIFQNTNDYAKGLSKLIMIVEEMIAVGNTVAVRWHDEGIHDNGDFQGYAEVPNEKAMTWQGMSFYRLDGNGLIIEEFVVTNIIEAFEMRQRAAKQADQN